MYFVSKNIEFDFYKFNEISEISKVIANNNEKFKNQVFSYNLQDCQTRFLARPIIIFIEFYWTLDCFCLYFKNLRHHNQPLTNFVVIKDSVASELESLVFKLDRLSYDSDTVLQFTYFVILSPKFIYLKTISWFLKGLCNVPMLKNLNFFNKTSMKWDQPLEYYDKFSNFYGCELVLMLPIIRSDYDPRIWGYGEFNINKTKIRTKGLIPYAFNILAKKYNFVCRYQSFWPFSNESLLSDQSNRKNLEFINADGGFRTPNVYFEVIDFASGFFSSDLSTTSPFFAISQFLIVTPAEVYSAYEKLSLPFDRETWILLLITFSIAFFTIFIINKLSKILQEVIYGKRIKTPAFNIVIIFFGISQTRIPNENFSRQILIFFVYFCLVFRTCYQSKIFEFMTSNPRRTPPKTIDDLIERDYTIYSTEELNLETIVPSKDKK